MTLVGAYGCRALRREFSLFVNRLGEMVYGLTLSRDQSIYESTSP